MTRFIPLASPDIKDEDIKAVADVLRSGMLVQGEKILQFEKMTADYFGVQNSIALSNGTATLHLSLLAAGIKAGDEVIVPAFSYVATANVVELVGATPVFVDIDLATFNIDVSQIENKITPKTKAIIPVHEFGLACDIKAVCGIAAKYNLVVIEDAACALGARQDSQLAGTFGDFGSFSFHPRKAISSGEGGLLLAKEDSQAKKIRTLRNHGIEMIDNKMEFVEAGFNYRMTDFQGALIISQFPRIEKIIAYKNDLAKHYAHLIKNNLVTLPSIPAGRNHTWQTYHLVLDKSLNRDALILNLKNQGIGTNYGAQCIPAQLFYKKKYNLDSVKLFPNSMVAYTQGLAIPLYEKLNEADISYISDKINQLK